jgi:phage shock protein A
MSMFPRLLGNVVSLLRELLDPAVDPERFTARIIHELENRLATARHAAALAFAAERLLARELEHARSAAEQSEDRAACLAAEHAIAQQTNADLQAALQALTACLDEARQRRRILLARYQAALARLALQQALATAEGDPDAPLSRLARLESGLTEFEHDLRPSGAANA